MELDEYYDIDAILTEQQRLPCVALHDFSKEVNLTGDHSEVRRNTRVELPYWIARSLAQYTLPNNESLITVELPKIYGSKVRNALIASPTNVDFKLLCPYFYAFSIKLLDLVIDDTLGGILEKAFKIRFRDIMNYSQAVTSTIGQDFIQKLDETEKELFRAGQESALSSKCWRDRSIHQIKTIDLGAK